jgi:hypothetical protein
MAEVFPEKRPVRCAGCGFSHERCEEHEAALAWIHRAVNLLERSAQPAAVVTPLLDEYDARWE